MFVIIFTAVIILFVIYLFYVSTHIEPTVSYANEQDQVMKIKLFNIQGRPDESMRDAGEAVKHLEMKP